MAAAETSSAQLSNGFVDAYEMARRSMFDAAARVLRYHATARDLKRGHAPNAAGGAEAKRATPPNTAAGN